MGDDKLNLIGYHGTPEHQVENINKNGFKFDIRAIQVSDILNKKIEKLPYDLGNGVYTFINDDYFGFNGLNNARAYLLSTKRKENRYAVLRVEICIDCVEHPVLNLNIQENQRKYILMRNNMYDFVQEVIDANRDELNKYDENCFKRGNLDGVFIELFINRFKLKPVAVIKDTFTKFENCYKISSFPNGRELVIRNKDIIKKIDVHCKFSRSLYYKEKGD